jgi:NifU-like protein involved in Fe-S cluster formation
MSDADLLRLYSQRVLALTTAIPHVGRLDEPDGAARRRSPLCGSSVGVEVQVENGRITGFAQDVRACALGQAAAAVVGGGVVGRTRDEVAEGRDALKAMLGGGPAPEAPWGDLVALAVAREHPNRHASILLAFEATLDAMDDAEKKAVARRGAGDG